MSSSIGVPGFTVVLTALFLLGCGPGENSDPQKIPHLISSSTPSTSAVQLTPSQVNAVRIQIVRTYHFPVVREELGSIGFQEDPSTVQAESSLVAAAATFEMTKKELARAKALGQANGIAQKELEQTVSAEQAAQASLKAAQDAVRALGVNDAEIKRMVATARIQSTPVSHKWAVADVAETDSPLIKLGQPVDVTVAAYPHRTFEGQVSRIYTTVDPITHRETVRCEIKDPKNELRVGMLANFAIHIQSAMDSVAVPADSVVREGDGTMTAWVTKDRRTFFQRVVETGLRQDGKVQILKGLSPGELVVTNGAIFLDNMLQGPAVD